ncbi:MAG: tetratricopeptide repeat protein [Myxococcota bacterium]|jgi:Tfp pilus assembly protein PilF|nr:tetratricopeptide repeat protein [Myxococcota bacterium]
MSRLLPALLVLGGLGLSGCASSSAGAGRGTVTPAATPVATTSSAAEQLAAATSATPAAEAAPARPTPPPPPPPPAAAETDPVAGREASPQALALFQKGMESLWEGDTTKASESLRRALQAEPQLADARFNLATIAERQGKLEDAEQGYLETLRLQGTHREAAYNLANLLVRRDSLARAAQRLATLGEGLPDCLPLRNNLHRLWLQSDRVDQAVEEAKAVLKIDESNVDAMLNLAVGYTRQGKIELARMVLDIVARREPNNAEVEYRRALIWLKQGKKPAAIESLKKTVTLRPDFAEAHNHLGVLFLDAGDFLGAVEQFQAALGAYPGFKEAQLNLGSALRGQQKLSEAEAAYRKVIDLDRTYAPAYFNLGILFLDAKGSDTEDRIRKLRSAIEQFNQYKAILGPRLAAGDQADGYIEEAKRLIQVEEQRREAEREALKAAPVTSAEGGAEGGPADDPGAGESPAGADDGQGETSLEVEPPSGAAPGPAVKSPPTSPPPAEPETAEPETAEPEEAPDAEGVEIRPGDEEATGEAPEAPAEDDAPFAPYGTTTTKGGRNAR